MHIDFTAIRPMLAQSFTGRTPQELVFSQPKLDGVRCIATSHGLYTRTGRRIRSCPHIERSLAPLFVADPAAALDGELYCPDLDLSTIIGLVNTRSPDARKQLLCERHIQLHVFDQAFHNGVFSERWINLNRTLRPLLNLSAPISFVGTASVSGGQAHLDQLYASYLAAGYEGQMIRLDRPYEHRRSASLLKRKPFVDAEFIVERVDEVQGTHFGYAKRVVLRLPDGRTFAANIARDRDRAAALLQSKIHSATVRFNGRTPSGIPRCPVAVAFHSDEMRP